MLDLVIGSAQLVLALLLFHRVMPVRCAESRADALKVWLIGLALLCFGSVRLMAAFALAAPSLLHALGHGALVAGAALWLRHMRSARIRGWADVRQSRARRCPLVPKRGLP